MSRLRQPYCPDCLKGGIKRLKDKGYGYCRECGKRRQKVYRGYNNPDPNVEDALAVERGELALVNGQLSTEELIAREIRAENEDLKTKVKELERQLYLQEAFLRDSESPNAQLWTHNRDLKERVAQLEDQNRGMRDVLLQALTGLEEHGKLPLQLAATLEVLRSEVETQSPGAVAPGSQG